MTTLVRDDQTIGYACEGAGPRTVILAHNVLTDRSIFSDVARELARTTQVVSVDVRGHGESAGVRRRFTPRELGSDLLAVLDELGVRSALFVGVSLGAQAAVEAAVRAPERVEGLVLIGATPRRATLRERVEAAMSRPLVRLVGLPASLSSSFVPSLFGATFRREHAAAVADRVARVGAMPGRDVSFALRAWLDRRADADLLRGVRAPAWVVVGAEDAPCPPDHARELSACLSDARLVVVPVGGHTLPLEQPAIVAGVVAEALAATSSA